MKNLIKTILGEVELEQVENMKLRKVIKNRLRASSFLFNYGDGGHTDHRHYSEDYHYVCHRDDHVDYTEK